MDKINTEVFEEALKTMYSKPGMPGCYLQLHPYTHSWKFKIDYASGYTAEAESPDINEAISLVIKHLKEDVDAKTD